MADINRDIRAALEGKLANIVGIPPIAYENVNYDPTLGTSYVKSSFQPVSRRPAARGLNPQQLYTGNFIVTVYSPEGNGPGTADAIAETLVEAFEATTDISYTNASAETIIVSIDYAERRQGIHDTPWYFIPVVIRWYIYK